MSRISPVDIGNAEHGDQVDVHLLQVITFKGNWIKSKSTTSAKISIKAPFLRTYRQSSRTANCETGQTSRHTEGQTHTIRGIISRVCDASWSITIAQERKYIWIFFVKHTQTSLNTFSIALNNQKLVLGRLFVVNPTGYSSDTTFDDLSFWNRPLTAEEIACL